MSSSTKTGGHRITILDFMLAADRRRLRAHERKLRSLAEQLVSSGLISSGSISRRYAPCGKPGCRCHGDPPQLHGPYWQWTTKVNGKTLTRNLSQSQARLYQEWIANRRRLIAIVAEMEEVSRQAAEILLADPLAPSEPLSSSKELGRPRMPTRRVTRPTAEALVRLAELIEPAAEAAQEWLEAMDDEDDPAAIAEARDRLLASLDESPDLITTVSRLLRLLGTLAQQTEQIIRPNFHQPKSNDSTPSHP
jgi:hypothetical protein